MPRTRRPLGEGGLHDGGWAEGEKRPSGVCEKSSAKENPDGERGQGMRKILLHDDERTAQEKGSK